MSVLSKLSAQRTPLGAVLWLSSWCVMEVQLVVSGRWTVSLLRRVSFPLETLSSLQTLSPLLTSMLRTAWANLSWKMCSPLATWPNEHWWRERRTIYDFGPSLTGVKREESDLRFWGKSYRWESWSCHPILDPRESQAKYAVPVGCECLVSSL